MHSLGCYTAYSGNFLPTSYMSTLQGTRNPSLSLVKIDSVETVIYLNFIRTFHIYCPIWVNFAIRHLRIIPLRGCEFRGIRLQWNYVILIVKNAVVKSVYFITGQARTNCNIVVFLYKYLFVLFFCFPGTLLPVNWAKAMLLVATPYTRYVATRLVMLLN